MGGCQAYSLTVHHDHVLYMDFLGSGGAIGLDYRLPLASAVETPRLYAPLSVAGCFCLSCCLAVSVCFRLFCPSVSVCLWIW